MKEIECDVCLGHEEVPFGKGELGVTGGETGAEVVLPQVWLNCAFDSIASVDMWWDALESDAVLLEGLLLEFVEALVVKNVEFWGSIAVRLELVMKTRPGGG